MRQRGRRTTLSGLGLALLAVAIAGCGSSGSATGGAQAGSRTTRLERELRARSRADYFGHLRDAVLRGAQRDFAQGTGVGGPAFESCLSGLLREGLDRPAITRLVAVYRRPGGQQFAAQALNALAAPLAARCGHRALVPELVEASRGLREGRPTGAAVRRLGVTYGPYLGLRCRSPDRHSCDRVGIDVVLNRGASRVTASVGGLRARLRTPGLHDGVRFRDWVGTFSPAEVDRPGSPFHVPSGRGARGWAGSPPVYVAVELRVRFADGRRAGAIFRHVFLSPGWG